MCVFSISACFFIDSFYKHLSVFGAVHKLHVPNDAILNVAAMLYDFLCVCVCASVYVCLFIAKVSAVL